MKKQVLLLLAILLQVFAALNAAETSPIFYFSTLNLKDGLSQLSVITILEDSKGFMWFGTRNGLNKYDGEQFSIYRHDNNKPNSLTDNHITVLLRDDRNKALWIGTNNGFNHLDLTTNTITPYYQSDSLPLSNTEIIALALDSRERLWIGTRSGLYIFERTTGSLRRIDFDGLIASEAITALYISQNDRVFIGTRNKGLLLCDLQFTILTHLTAPSITDNTISAIYEDSRKQLWIGTPTRGINKWEIESNTITHYTTANSSLTDNSVRCFAEHNTNLIIGTFNGLSILNQQTGTITRYNNFDVREGSLSHFSVYSLCVDKVGTLWVGTYSGGVNYYNPLNNRFTFYHPQNSPNELFGIFGTLIYHQPEGCLWIATEGGGLLQFDPQKKTFCNYLMENTPKDQRAHNQNIIKALTLDGAYIWCGTNNGSIYKFHIPTKTFSLYYKFQSDRNIGIYSLFKDKQNALWVGTTTGEGLVKITPDKQAVSRFKVKGTDRPVHFTSIRSFMELREGVYLIGTRAAGLFKYDSHAKTLTTYNTRETAANRRLENNYITTLMRRANGEIWIGTFGGGIYRYEENEGIVQKLTTANGLIDDNVCAIVEDNNNALWISAGPGISELNLHNLQFHNYSRLNGIEVREFSPNGGIRLPDGNFYFTGSNGFLSFSNRSLTRNKYIPPVMLTALTVNNTVIKPNDDTQLLTNTIDDTQKLVLHHDQNNFSIAYTALNFIFHQQNQYAYRLLGNETQWNNVGTRKEAFYNNLSPGEYIFQVIASNNDGLWNKEGKSIHIRILPPWWATPAAYTLYVLVILLITGTIGYNIYIRQKLKHDLSIKQVEKQALEEFHQTKTRLFTNFSHELRTPLTLIITPLEELLNQAELSTALRRKLDLMAKHSKRLLLLVNQLMDLQKNQAGNMQLQVSEDRPANYLREIYFAFRQISESKKIDFQYHAPEEEIKAWFDHSMLEKVVFNLLSNAFKFTAAGETVALTLEVTERQEAQTTRRYMTICVSDTGKGISEDERQHIFTPFYQADGSDLFSQTNGTGIGLSLTQSIVRLHHGLISVEQNRPKGCIFRVEIPIDKESYSDKEISTSAPWSVEQANASALAQAESNNIEVNNGGSTATPAIRRTVLLVEDNEDIRQYMKDRLTAHYRVLEAADGIEAFDRVVKEYPDIVISDIMMPRMDGLELCSLIKNDLRTGHIPVVLITARSMVMHIKEGFLSGADDYVVKPFNMDVLLARINNLLTLRDRLRETYGKKFSLESMGIDTVSADDRFMQKLFEIIEEHLSSPELNIELLCKEIGFSRANFYRKLKAITDLSPADLIKNKRLEIAARMLRETDMNVSEVSMQTGFSTPAYFAKVFRTVYGMSPTEWTKKEMILPAKETHRTDLF